MCLIGRVNQMTSLIMLFKINKLMGRRGIVKVAVVRRIVNIKIMKSTSVIEIEENLRNMFLFTWKKMTVAKRKVTKFLENSHLIPASTGTLQYADKAHLKCFSS